MVDTLTNEQDQAEKKMTKLASWGRYPSIQASAEFPYSEPEVADAMRTNSYMIPRGGGRSYGDSAMAPRVLDTRHLDRFIDFDRETGLLACQAGVTLREIIVLALPCGWFLPVTPGTKFVTIGGAIASDVHGKNHHGAGCFSDHIDFFDLATPARGVVRITRETEPELFRATCGGMGLTGVILRAGIRLRRVESAVMRQRTIRTRNLEETLEHFRTHADWSYSVAWIDCLKRGNGLGRSILSLAEHHDDRDLHFRDAHKMTVPDIVPGFLLNRFSIKAFNTLYYHRASSKASDSCVDIDTYFYPLDNLLEWNRLYGRGGFVQYQFVLPAARSDRMNGIVDRIAAAGLGSFLAVLKWMGPANDNYLSFPLEGPTLALDFRLSPRTLRLLDELDNEVVAAGGRVYLTKDSRLSPERFREMYPMVEQFQHVKSRIDPERRLQSLQSRRLEI